MSHSHQDVQINYTSLQPVRRGFVGVEPSSKPSNKRVLWTLDKDHQVRLSFVAEHFKELFLKCSVSGTFPKCISHTLLLAGDLPRLNQELKKEVVEAVLRFIFVCRRRPGVHQIIPIFNVLRSLRMKRQILELLKQVENMKLNEIAVVFIKTISNRQQNRKTEVDVDSLLAPVRKQRRKQRREVRTYFGYVESVLQLKCFQILRSRTSELLTNVNICRALEQVQSLTDLQRTDLTVPSILQHKDVKMDASIAKSTLWGLRRELLSTLYKEKEYHDVVLVAKDGGEFKAHLVVLVLASNFVSTSFKDLISFKSSTCSSSSKERSDRTSWRPAGSRYNF